VGLEGDSDELTDMKMLKNYDKKDLLYEVKEPPPK